MKKVILILIGILFHLSARCSQVAVGVDSDKLIVLEYWKFEQEIVSNKVMLYNPTNKTIQVKLKIWHSKKQSFLEKLITKNVVFRNKTIKPHQYKILNLADKIAVKRLKGLGLIQFFVNGESAGLYQYKSKMKNPNYSIDKGIVINRAPNSGGILMYDILYRQSEFNNEDEIIAEVRYLDNKFYRSSFHKGKGYNPFRIGIRIEEYENLNLNKTVTSDVEITPKEQIGYFKVIFSDFENKGRITQRNFSHMINEGTGRTIAFVIPRKIRF